MLETTIPMVDSRALIEFFEVVHSRLEDIELGELVADLYGVGSQACLFLVWLEDHDIYNTTDFILNLPRLEKALEDEWSQVSN